MSDPIQSLLDALPEGAVQTGGGLVLAANEKARQYLPQLAAGEPFPGAVAFPAPGETETGSFISGGVSYSYSCKDNGPEQMILFRPGAPGILESWQADGALRQLRELLGDMLAEAGSSGGQTSAAFNKAFHRLFRLIGNLEFMQQAAEPEGTAFRPGVVELDGLCREMVWRAADLLREAGVALEYRSRESGLLVPGDPELLKKLLLGLISNAARAAGEGTVCVTLRRRGEQARIVVSGTGTAFDGRQLDALFRGRPGGGPPLPGQGAGLGLSIARHIVRLHGGALLPYREGSAAGVLVSLPAGPLNGQTPVRTPSVQRDGGLDPVLTELSDILPASLFGMEGMD